MRKRIVGLGIIVMVCGLFWWSADAADDPSFTMTHAADREGVDLSGIWSYSIDPYRDGLYGFHGSPSGQGHQRFDPRDVAAYTAENPTALFEYDMRLSEKVELPGSWLTHAPQMRHYEGLVWYARRFEIPRLRRQRAFIHVGAANYSARVYVNGELIGTHEGGFTPFVFEVTRLIEPGENHIAIGVDSIRTEASVPPPVTDWETYGGITRPVRLVVVPETFIDDAWVRLSDAGKILADIRLDGSKAGNRKVSVRIPSLNWEMNGRTDASGVWHGSVDAPSGLEKWSPETPKLYDVVVKVADDSLDERIGFRTLAVEGEDILLNGEPVFLRGISVHEEELGPNPSRRITEDAARALLTEVKEGLNGNFVRLAHYPHSEVMTRMADEIGLLVWSEIPVYWRIDWSNPDTLATARKMLAENIRRDRNRVSIAFWSIGNETPVSDARNAFLGKLAADVRALDDTRLVTAALLTETKSVNGVLVAEIDDPLTPLLDVMAVNTYNGWYGPVPVAEVSEIRWRSDHGKPLIFSEFGAGALAGFRDPNVRRKFSEDYQEEYYRETLEMADSVPFLRGTSPWILKDFRSPRRQHPVYQEGWNRKGVISETGERKPAFFVLSDYYAGKAAQTDK